MALESASEYRPSGSAGVPPELILRRVQQSSAQPFLGGYLSEQTDNRLCPSSHEQNAKTSYCIPCSDTAA